MKIKIAALAIAACILPSSTVQAPIRLQTDLERRQEIWISALEWCESRGIETAINPKDTDGTPSYGAFQFKPSTFTYFSERYNLSTTTMHTDAVQQREIVRRMINDEKITDAQLRTQQFPDCIQRKIGLPPRK